MIQEGDRTYFYVEAKKIDTHYTTRFEQTIFTRKTELADQHEAIWSYVYRALRLGIGDKLIITCIEKVNPPYSADN